MYTPWKHLCITYIFIIIIITNTPSQFDCIILPGGGAVAAVASFVPYNNGKPNQTHTLHTLLFSQSVSVKMCLYFFFRFQGRSLVTVVVAAALRHDNYMYIHKKANKRLHRAAANKRTRARTRPKMCLKAFVRAHIYIHTHSTKQ